MDESNGKRNRKMQVCVQEHSANSAPGMEKVVEVCAQPGDFVVGLNTGRELPGVGLEGGRERERELRDPRGRETQL